MYMAPQALSLVPLLAALAMLALPETPYWLVEHGKDEEARFVYQGFDSNKGQLA